MTIRWVLLGPGRHATRSVVPQMKRAEGVELVAVVSRDRARGEAFARDQGIPRVYTALDEALGDRQVDAIYDATPDGLHADHAIAAAKAGKHVLVEKPLAISVAACAKAISACRQHGVKLGVVFNQRHEAVHQEARRKVLEGEIGDVKLVHVQIALGMTTPRATSAGTSWRNDPRMRAGGIVVSIGDHAHDTLAFIAGQRIDEVSALTDASKNDPPDERVVGILLKLSGGAIGYAAASYATSFARRPFEIHGTKGTLVIEHSYTYLTGASGDPTPTLTLVNASGSTVQRFAASECFRLEIEQFNHAIEGRGEPMTPPEEGLRALAIGDAIYSAVRDRRAAKVAAFMPE